MPAPHTPPPAAASPGATPRRRSPWKWALLAVAAFFLLAALYRSLNPYGDADYVGVSHGDHTHYVPRDWDGSTSISTFPTVPPGPGEQILPDGRVVPRR
ncbi:MAG: hypothetical protein R3362_03605 [Rhodothermales bacterium]|nr:hypothetical protein [Rhodothermales bacterium]